MKVKEFGKPVFSEGWERQVGYIVVADGALGNTWFPNTKSD
jgi:hypothetical protein